MESGQQKYTRKYCLFLLKNCVAMERVFRDVNMCPFTGKEEGGELLFPDIRRK